MSSVPPPPLMESPPGPETVIDGRPYLYFAGTSYFGLHGHPDVIEAGVNALRALGVHSATTRAGFGTIRPVVEVERLAAQFFGTAAAFYFTSGYTGNHILVQAVAHGADAVFVDETAHFCVVEAAKLAGLPCFPFRSRDAADLEEQLSRHLAPGGRPLVLADGVGPSTGRLAPVADFLAVLAKFAPALLMLDDAHGFGVLGNDGRGILDHAGVWPDANSGIARPDGISLAVSGTLAKALGGFGGVIVGSEDFVRKARTASHYYDGSSAPAAPVAGSTARALELVIADPSLRTRLRKNAAALRKGLRALGAEVEDSPAAQAGVVIGDADNMRRLHTGLREQGILVPYVSAYSGLPPQGMLRFAACAGHTPAMISRLLDTLKSLL